MKNHYKSNKIKFCPLCGNKLVTHLGNGVFVCGSGNAELEALSKVLWGNTSCNRTFSVVHPLIEGRNWQQINRKHRQEIGIKVKQIKHSKGLE
jgi:hypothetical protein